MARSIFACFLLFVAVLVGVTSSNAQGVGTGIVVNGSAIVQVNVTGRMVCNLLGNPITGLPNPPVVGVNVTLSCNGGQTMVGQAMTDTMGNFQIIVDASNINLFNLTSCRVIVPLPINGSCIILPGLGSLQAPISITTFVQIAGGVVLNIVTLPFRLFLL